MQCKFLFSCSTWQGLSHRLISEASAVVDAGDWPYDPLSRLQTLLIRHVDPRSSDSDLSPWLDSAEQTLTGLPQTLTALSLQSAPSDRLVGGELGSLWQWLPNLHTLELDVASFHTGHIPELKPHLHTLALRAKPKYREDEYDILDALICVAESRAGHSLTCLELRGDFLSSSPQQTLDTIPNNYLKNMNATIKKGLPNLRVLSIICDGLTDVLSDLTRLPPTSISTLCLQADFLDDSPADSEDERVQHRLTNTFLPLLAPLEHLTTSHPTLDVRLVVRDRCSQAGFITR